MDPDAKAFVLLVVGFALLLNPFVPGVHLGEGGVYRYDAAQVEYVDDANREGGLQATSVRTGDARDHLSIDDEIICAGLALQRACRFESHVLDGGNVTTYPRSMGGVSYEFVYLRERLYRPTSVERDDESYMALEQVNESDPLSSVATRNDLPAAEREVVETGRIKTHHELPHEGQLVEVDGEYYTIYATASKSYSRLGANSCAGGEQFCESATQKRLVDTGLTLASWLAGLWLLFRVRERL